MRKDERKEFWTMVGLVALILIVGYAAFWGIFWFGYRMDVIL